METTAKLHLHKKIFILFFIIIQSGRGKLKRKPKYKGTLTCMVQRLLHK